MSENTRPTLDPEPASTGADFTATVTASPQAWQTLTDSLDRINAGFAARDAEKG
ncbi:hypothetical protein [Streptacidiphilus sp. PAMC 29251]